MSLTELTRKAGKALQENSPTILTALGVTGTLSTAYLTARATAKAIRIIDDRESKGGISDRNLRRIKERAQDVWTLYIPAVASGVLTVTVIIAGHKVGSKRAAAAYSLLGVSERAFEEYSAKVVEQLGKNKEQAIRDEVMQDRVNANPTSMVVMGTGKVLCMEAHTGRYFECDMETLRKAENTINQQILRTDEATLTDFYYLVGLEPTPYSSYSGWRSDKIVELKYSAVLHKGTPCICFDYNYVKSLY